MKKGYLVLVFLMVSALLLFTSFQAFAAPCKDKCVKSCAASPAKTSDKCTCGDKCTSKDGKCTCGDKCKCKSGGKCTCGDKCGCKSGGKCTCDDKCKCKSDGKCTCKNCKSAVKGTDYRCSCGGKCDCCKKCPCKDKCICGGTCECCDNCKCSMIGNGFMHGTPSVDGPNLIVERKNGKKKSVVVTGATELYPPTMNMGKAKAVNVKFVVKSGLAQAVLIADGQYSFIERTWSKEAKRYVYSIEKKKIK